MGVKNWFEFTGVSNNQGFEKSGVKYYSVRVKHYSEGNDSLFKVAA